MATLDVVENQPDGTLGVHLRLLRADDSAIGDRHLLLRGGCQDMAEAIAAVIAAWETEPPSAPPVRVAPAARAESVTTAALPAASASRRAPIQVQGGLGVGAGFVGGTAAIGIVELHVGRADSRWQLRLGAMAERARQLDLAPGRVDWQHTMAEAGLLVRSRGRTLVWSLDAGPSVGWATHQGKGYAPDRQQSSLEYGAVSGARVGLRSGRWAVWAQARGSLWLRGQRVVLTSSTTTADLPRGDVSVSVGTTILLFQ